MKLLYGLTPIIMHYKHANQMITNDRTYAFFGCPWALEGLSAISRIDGYKDVNNYSNDIWHGSGTPDTLDNTDGSCIEPRYYFGDMYSI